MVWRAVCEQIRESPSIRLKVSNTKMDRSQVCAIWVIRGVLLPCGYGAVEALLMGDRWIKPKILAAFCPGVVVNVEV